MNVSVGLWQVSRVYAVLGDAEASARYAQECVDISDGSELPPFYRAFAYEAAARAASLAEDKNVSVVALNRARELTAEIEDKEEVAMLEADFRTIPY